MRWINLGYSTMMEWTRKLKGKHGSTFVLLSALLIHRRTWHLLFLADEAPTSRTLETFSPSQTTRLLPAGSFNGKGHFNGANKTNVIIFSNYFNLKTAQSLRGLLSDLPVCSSFPRPWIACVLGELRYK